MLILKNLLISLIFMVLLTTNCFAEETWKITSLDWQPYSGAELSNQGNSIQQLRQLLKKEDISLIVEFYPWKRAQSKAKTEEFIGYFPAWPEEVKKGFIASPAIDMSEIAIIKNTDSVVEYDNIEDLFSKYVVGLVMTYSYPKTIDKAAKNNPENVDNAPNEVALMKKLSGGRHPVAITDPNVIQYLADKNGVGNIQVEEIVMKKELVISFSDTPENRKRIKLLKKLTDK